MLNKYIKCNFGGKRGGTSTIDDIRGLKVKGSVTIGAVLSEDEEDLNSEWPSFIKKKLEDVQSPAPPKKVSVTHTTSSEPHTVGYIFMLRGKTNELIHVFIKMLVTKTIRMLT